MTATIYLLYININLDRKLKTAIIDRQTLEDAAEDLRLSSDELTKFARMYVVTGNPEYKDNFDKVKQIRNGELPRPRDYHNIYWDLPEPEHSLRHPDGKAVSLRELFNRLPLADNERVKLEKAYEHSEDLTYLENEAFNAMEGLFKDDMGEYTVHGEPDRQYAIGLLYSNDYLQVKQNIMRPIDDFMGMIENRMEGNVDRLTRLAEINLHVFQAVNVVFFIVNMLIYVLLHIRIVMVISNMITVIRKNKKDNTEMNIVLPGRQRRDELGELISEFNNMSVIITNRSRLLEQSNSKLVNQYNMIDKYIIIFESTPEGIIIQVSTAFCRVSGYSMGELIGSRHRMMSGSGDSEGTPVDLSSLVSDGRNWEGEMHSRRKDGTTYWF